MYDLKICNGQMIDLKTGEREIADIGVVGRVITDIGHCPESAKTTIDAEGLVVSPGFIDIHMHEERLNTEDPDSYDIGYAMLNMGVTTCAAGNCGANYQSLETLFSYIDQHGAPVNYLCGVGHTSLRETAGNLDRYKKSTKEQIKKMIEMANQGIRHGAYGVTFGLEYCPGTDFDEIIDLLNGIEKRDILTCFHYRKDGPGILEAVREMVAVGKETRLPVQISHLGSGAAMGHMKESLAMISRSIESGVDVLADCYPYSAFATSIGSAVYDDGCFENWNKSYDSIMLAHDPYKGQFCDKELFEKVRREYPKMSAIAFVMNEEEVIQALQAPFVMVASDGGLQNRQGHPRSAGTFPRVLGRYVREQNSMPLHAALNKMTRMPAQRLGLTQKGSLETGYDADIVLFDEHQILDCADYQHPVREPLGIKTVIVGGKVALDHGKLVNSRLGTVIRK